MPAHRALRKLDVGVEEAVAAEDVALHADADERTLPSVIDREPDPDRQSLAELNLEAAGAAADQRAPESAIVEDRPSTSEE